MSQTSDSDQPSPPVPRTRGPSPEKTAQTRQQILQVAMEELIEHGYAATTMTRVAERAGLAKGTPYRYFVSKEALFLDLMRELAADPLRRMREQPIAPDETVNGYCRRVLLPIMRVIEETGRANIARLALTESRSFAELTEAYRRDVYLPFVQHVTELAARAVQNDEVSGRDPALLAHLLVAPLWMGLIRNGILAPDDPVCTGDLFEAQLDFIFGRPAEGGAQAQ